MSRHKLVWSAWAGHNTVQTGLCFPSADTNEILVRLVFRKVLSVCWLSKNETLSKRTKRVDSLDHNSWMRVQFPPPPFRPQNATPWFYWICNKSRGFVLLPVVKISLMTKPVSSVSFLINRHGKTKSCGTPCFDGNAGGGYESENIFFGCFWRIWTKHNTKIKATEKLTGP